MVISSENPQMKNNKGSSKPSTSGNYMYNIVLEVIHHVLGKQVRTYSINKTYVDEYEPWSVILTAAVFVICSEANRLNIIVQANYYLAVI